MIPVSFLFDREGKRRYYFGGEVFEKELIPVLEAFAAGTLVDGEMRFPLAPGKSDR
jgi:hypothetical protein